MAAIARYFDASTFDALRFLTSQLIISNVRELSHEFSHSLGHEATFARFARFAQFGEVLARRGSAAVAVPPGADKRLTELLD